MILKENSLSATIRGFSTTQKKVAVSGLRTIEPKFFRGLGERPSSKKKNNYLPYITILKKENISPEQVTILSSPKSKEKQSSSLINIPTRQGLTIQIFPRGLHNIGNSCYMNSTLQCLLHLRHFSEGLIEQLKILKPEQRAIPSVAYEIALIIKEMQNRNGGALNLGALKKCVGRKKPIFLGNSQQDAQQYLTTILQILNEELSRIKTKSKYKQLDGDPTKKSLAEISDQWWKYYKQRDDSLVCDLFQGQTISTLTCKKCAKSSVNFDNVWGLPATFHRNMSVSQLLINNSKTETLVEDFFCSDCKKHRNCSKVVEMFRLPKFLIIQLKRFQFDKGQKRKRKEDIKIDTELNLCKLLNKEADKNQESIYRLKGVVNHRGEAEYGHYYSEILCDSLKKWFVVNDSSVEETELEEMSGSGYLLFYEQLI